MRCVRTWSGRTLAGVLLLGALGCAKRRCAPWIENGSLAAYGQPRPTTGPVVLQGGHAAPIERSALSRDILDAGLRAAAFDAAGRGSAWNACLEASVCAAPGGVPEEGGGAGKGLREALRDAPGPCDLAWEPEIRELCPYLGVPGFDVGIAVEALAEAEASSRCESVLALSGGGQNGAFGAGFLKQWYDAREPDFAPNIVTGVSTGALQASFVFVNTDWAWDCLEEAYTSAGTDSLIEDRPLIAVPFSTSLATARGLERMVSRYVSDALIDAVAAEGSNPHHPRHLYVGTVNMDTGILNVWDMVALARERSYDRYRLVLRASAHCPPTFPPVMIDGMPHQDGGLRQQIFVKSLIEISEREHLARRARIEAAVTRFERALEDRKPALGVPPGGEALRARLHALRDRARDLHAHATFVVNGSLESLTHCTQMHFLDVNLRAVTLLEEEALIGTIWKCWDQLELYGPVTGGCGGRFRLVSLPEWARIRKASTIRFSREDVRALFRAGCKVATQADPWIHHPSELPNVVAFQPGAGEPVPAPCPVEPPGECPLPPIVR